MTDEYIDLLKANLKDTLQDLIVEIAIDVYENANNINRSASKAY